MGYSSAGIAIIPAMTPRKHAAAILLFAALSVFMTWPLLPNINRAVAYPGDPYINTWVLDWDWHATFHQPGRLFQANIFYPAKYSLAFSENLYGIAVVLFPLRALAVTPLLAYNVAMLLGYTLCGFSAYLLAYEVTGSVWGAITAGIFYAFVPYRFTHAAHVQYVWAGTLPLLLFAFFVTHASPTGVTPCGSARPFSGTVYQTSTSSSSERSPSS